MKELVYKLLQVWGPPGYEHQVRQVIREEVEPHADEITVDPLGNMICRVGSGGKKVMVAAHMDVIGVMATYREPTSGYLRFENMGGVLNSSLLGSRVRFEDGTLGTIGVHDQWGEGRTKAPSFDKFFIDVSTGDNAEFSIGQPAVFDVPPGERGTRLFGRGMDDRVGCAVLIEAMRQLETPHEVYFVFTTQEEVGLRGAQAAVYNVQPDVGLAVDVTASGDEPHGVKMSVKLGEGVAIKVKDSGIVVPAAVRDWMIDTAEANNIPYQLELLPFGSTDAARMQVALGGIASGVVSIPCRYVHTNSETVDTSDVQASVDLLTALLTNPIDI